jgi:cbb3-type cytochrome oxidase maturation protein
MDITFYLFFVSLLVAFAAWCIFLWAIRTGQFHEVEEIKFQVWPEQRIESQTHATPPPTPEAALGGRADQP